MGYCTSGLDYCALGSRHCKVGREVYLEVCFLGRMSEERRWCYVCSLVQGEGARYAALYSLLRRALWTLEGGAMGWWILDGEGGDAVGFIWCACIWFVVDGDCGVFLIEKEMNRFCWCRSRFL